MIQAGKTRNMFSSSLSGCLKKDTHLFVYQSLLLLHKVFQRLQFAQMAR